MLDDLARHNRDIPRARNMIGRRVVKSVRVLKMRVLHAQLLGARIHLGNKGFLAAGYVFRKRDRGIVRGGHNQAFEQVVDAHFLADFEINLRAAHTRRMLARLYHVGKLDGPGVERFKNEQHRHHLGDGCRRKRLVRVLFKENPAGFRIH